MPIVELTRPGPAPERDAAACLDGVATLARVLDGLPWVLAGGLCIPLTLGRFHRSHDDIDVIYPVEAGGAIAAAMARAGYRLTTRLSLSLFGRFRRHLHLPVAARGPLAWRGRRLAFRDRTGRRPPDHLLRQVEALPYRVRDGWLESCDGRYRLRMDRPLAGARVRLAGGVVVPCLDLHYVEQIKVPLRGAKHALDLAVIREVAVVAATWR